MRVFSKLCYFLIIFCIFTCLVGCSGTDQPGPMAWIMGPGDKIRGKKYFSKYACFACHTQNPSPQSKQNFPLALNKKNNSEIALAILDPKHLTLAPNAGSEKLGAYADVLSVQEVRDLLAYLKTLRVKDPGP